METGVNQHHKSVCVFDCDTTVRSSVLVRVNRREPTQSGGVLKACAEVCGEGWVKIS